LICAWVEVFEIEGEGFLGIEERDTPNTYSVGKHDPDKGEEENFFIFEPGFYHLVRTIEKVNLPTSLSGIIFPRTTLFRSGIAMFNGVVQPGYAGELTFGLCNQSQSSIKISFGARIAHITFHEVLGEGSRYRGQWQGGRVATDGKETQV
jgi:deoxycytidine triphosphate deaminase